MQMAVRQGVISIMGSQPNADDYCFSLNPESVQKVSKKEKKKSLVKQENTAFNAIETRAQ